MLGPARFDFRDIESRTETSINILSITSPVLVMLELFVLLNLNPNFAASCDEDA